VRDSVGAYAELSKLGIVLLVAVLLSNEVRRRGTGVRS